MTTIEINREASTRLSRQVWRFLADTDNIRLVMRLVQHRVEARQTLRHKYRAIGTWSAYQRSHVDAAPPAFIPKDVLDDALKELLVGWIAPIGFSR